MNKLPSAALRGVQAILFGAWLSPEDMELRWDVARDYLSACDRRGSRPSVWGAYDFLHGEGLGSE